MECTNTTTNIEKRYVKKQNNLQVIVHEEQFVVLKSFSESLKAVFTPWEKLSDGSYDSGVTVPENRLFRIQNFHSKLKSSKYTVGDEQIKFDCVSKFTPDFFPKDADYGWIHFLSKTYEENGEPILSIDDRMVIEAIEPVGTELLQQTKIEFETKNLKVFPIFFVKGMALGVVDRDSAILYVTLKDFGKLYCGVTNRTDLNNLIHNITPVFPIFSITISDKRSVVFLKLEGLKSFLNNSCDFNSGLLRFEYSFKDPSKMHVSIIGACGE